MLLVSVYCRPVQTSALSQVLPASRYLKGGGYTCGFPESAVSGVCFRMSSLRLRFFAKRHCCKPSIAGGRVENFTTLDGLRSGIL